ncbi:hypothetical protein JGI16_11664 [Candidatus Kryptonium thompsonii]|nr:hypothetical protein JGI16_11664 [Candidatus Kryptonium thompsoni]
MPVEKEKQMPKYYIPLPDFQALFKSLPPEIDEAKKHFIQVNKEILLANKIVTLYGAGQNDVFEQKAKTNKNGIAKFKVKNSGFQLVRLVHLRRCENCDNVNWESFWGSFSFEIPQR